MTGFRAARCAAVLLCLISGCTSEPVIRVTANSPAGVVVGIPGIDGGGTPEITLPWLRFHVTDDNAAQCRTQTIQIFDGQLKLWLPEFRFSQTGDFPAVAVMSRLTPPVITKAQAYTAVRDLANKLADECLKPSSPDLDLASARNAAAALIVANLPRYAEAELALTYGLSSNSGANWVDITPGMRLRINTSEVLRYLPQHKQRYYPGVTTFFLPRLRTSVLGGNPVLEVDPATELSDLGFNEVSEGSPFDNSFAVAGVEDLRVPPLDGTKRVSVRYWRLYLPTSPYVANDSGNTPDDAEMLNQLSVIAAAGSPGIFPDRALNATDCATPTSGQPRPLTCFEIRARGVVVPEIMIFVQGSPRWVPVGTRLSDIAAEVMPQPRSGAVSDAMPPMDSVLYEAWAARAWARLRVRRQTWFGEARLVFDAEDRPSAAAALSIPLITGDLVTW
jgi:hypothetical protein